MKEGEYKKAIEDFKQVTDMEADPEAYLKVKKRIDRRAEVEKELE